MQGTAIYCGPYLVEGTKASISKVAQIEKDHYVVTAKYTNNNDNQCSIHVDNVKLQCGVVYAIKSVSSGRYLDGRNKSHNNPLITNRNPKGDKFLHWTIVKTNGKNHFALKSVSSGFYLDGRNQNYDNPLITNRDPINDHFLQWTFQKTNGGANNVAIKSVSSKFYLDGRNPNHSNPLITNRNPMNDKYLQWQFIAQ